MPPGPADVSSVIPTESIPAGILLASKPEDKTFKLNPAIDRQAYRKIEGDPEPKDMSAARRECSLALKLASRPEVQNVLLGEAAVKYLYGRNKRDGEQDVDVIALLNAHDVIIGDAKGEYFAKAIVEQMPHTSLVLRSKGKKVVGGMVLAVQPKTVICSVVQDEGGRKWTQIGSNQPGVDPALFERRKPACDTGFVYLLDQGFNALHELPGFAIAPHTKFPLLETHIHAPRLDSSGHMQAGTWSHRHPFIIPSTSGARVRIGFVK